MEPQGPPPPPPPPPPPYDGGQGGGRPGPNGSPWGPTPDRPPQQRDGRAGPGGAGGGKIRPEQGWPRWMIWAVAGVFVAVLLSTALFGGQEGRKLSFGEFRSKVKSGDVAKATYNNTNGDISGEIKGTNEKFTTVGPTPLSDDDRKLLDDKLGTNIKFDTPQSGWLANLLPLLIPVALIIGFFIWMQRRAQGQMNGIMSIGRSKAKTYSTERPGTTFSDVAGYAGVKQEVTEVVDFLKFPEKFGQIGARIPKGVLLVGPPGTGKTLIARAVAGEAGVPFLSVSGSDFMEMFVGVGASRVRDLFQTARKLGKAIIFVDEIDSIGRKRGAGLGGGHDEREQTLNQMLSEMDGFEATEGIVMMAATNRPDILDSALLRPGRFDRQVVVPLPEFEERKAILVVHTKGKRMAPGVDLGVVARGSPGMSGADLANLVNEAALHAVREGSEQIELSHFEYARDRILMGQTRESMALSPEEKETTAYHEAGHAVCAAVLPHADPVHKVTIIPRGMALGVTQTVPPEDRHSLSKDALLDSLVMMMGGRVAEDLVFGHLTTGAANDLQKATERARAMVKELGMSERVGPRAWGQSGQVFLGEDLMQHHADFSEEVAQLIDEEIDALLRECERRCREVLSEHRNGLDLVARQLLEHETIDGAEVNRLIEVGRSEVTTSSANGEDSNGSAQGSSSAQPYDVHRRSSHPD